MNLSRLATGLYVKRWSALALIVAAVFSGAASVSCGSGVDVGFTGTDGARGAEILIDGESLGRLSEAPPSGGLSNELIPIVHKRVPPGSHQIEIRLKSGSSITGTFIPGESMVVSVVAEENRIVF